MGSVGGPPFFFFFFEHKLYSLCAMHHAYFSAFHWNNVYFYCPYSNKAINNEYK